MPLQHNSRLENQQLYTHECNLAVTEGRRMSLEVNKSPVSRELSLFYLTSCFSETPTHRVCLYLTLLSLCSKNSPSPLTFVENNQQQLFKTLQFPKTAITIGANEKMTKTFKRKSWEKRYPQKALESFSVFLQIYTYMCAEGFVETQETSEKALCSLP